ncbi:CBS domain-containing protein [Selenomonas ruminantium]|uniref:CBS domain-containing protein n=1 Tax=Selenomonas ruminantium TaxID=971 RepID=A0A1I3CPM0_SELRU|nr:nucleotidyltransferase family protein [Selenomonas ruminantium]SFH76338.1 CBS domain-containing protein [Selenomonas ruminantium]
MNNWEICLLDSSARVVDAARVIDASIAKIALVVDKDRKLLGCITDYDVRKAVLCGMDLLENKALSIMNANPKVIESSASNILIHQTMLNKNVRQLPLVDSKGCLCGLRILSEFDISRLKHSNPVILMAGGLGTRLRPLTDKCPKPLLRIGDKPIMEIILESFIQQGFSNFYISVNYKADMIEDYFGDGNRYGISINYIREKKRLGTAGALSLLPDNIEEPVLVMNGDLLTKVDFGQLLDCHNYRHADATMCVREYRYQVPYGVVDIADEKEWVITGLTEKPVHSAFVNAGIYMLNPEVIKDIPKDTYFDMTDVFALNIEKNRKNMAFPIREYWMDVGRMEDFERAREDFL